jgi:hypothetical protein|nr:MAG TPA: hypothetical protein [Caudoviricetes sp.]
MKTANEERIQTGDFNSFTVITTKGDLTMTVVTTSNKYNSFKHDLMTGDFGEAWTVKALMDIQGTELFKCDTPAFRSIDVDFTTDLTLSKSNNVDEIINSEFPLIEVKTDLSTYPNQCIEVVSNMNTGSPGWALVTEATHIFSVFPNLNKCYIYDGQLFREYAESIKDDPTIKTSILNTTGYDNKTLYNSKIKLVSRKKLQELGIVTRIIDLKTYDYLYIKAKH